MRGWSSRGVARISVAHNQRERAAAERQLRLGSMGDFGAGLFYNAASV